MNPEPPKYQMAGGPIITQIFNCIESLEYDDFHSVVKHFPCQFHIHAQSEECPCGKQESGDGAGRMGLVERMMLVRGDSDGGMR